MTRFFFRGSLSLLLSSSSSSFLIIKEIERYLSAKKKQIFLCCRHRGSQRKQDLCDTSERHRERKKERKKEKYIYSTHFPVVCLVCCVPGRHYHPTQRAREKGKLFFFLFFLIDGNQTNKVCYICIYI